MTRAAVPVLIPAYRPDRRLVALVRALRRAGLREVVVVDDGSGRAAAPVIAALRRLPGCTVLTHAVNLGKGRALKTGLNHLLAARGTALRGVVTADADGQHLPRDVRAVARRLAAGTAALLLGVRSFGPEVPFRSRFGNRLTRQVLRWVAGLRITDSQTGLRGLPPAFARRCVTLEGERYEYEMNMLLAANRLGLPLVEVPIATVYLDDNRSSHFHPLVDSLKIYRVLFRFTLSSLVTSGLDMLVFVGALAAHLGVGAGIVVARLVAGSFNYVTNDRLVFERDRWTPASLARYWALVAVLGTCAWGGIRWLVAEAGLDVYAAKVAVESVLFVASFTVQRDLVFAPRRLRG